MSGKASSQWDDDRYNPHVKQQDEWCKEAQCETKPLVACCPGQHAQKKTHNSLFHQQMSSFLAVKQAQTQYPGIWLQNVPDDLICVNDSYSSRCRCFGLPKWYIRAIMTSNIRRSDIAAAITKNRLEKQFPGLCFFICCLLWWWLESLCKNAVCRRPSAAVM